MNDGDASRNGDALKGGITLVTEFFPIGRDGWNDFTRSDDKYFDYFEVWARIHNDLVVYTIPEYVDRVYAIRRRFGRENTVVVPVEDYTAIDRPLLTMMERVCKAYRPFSMFPDKPEPSRPLYNYVTSLKYWCMKEAAALAKTDKLAWIDFGFDHGGSSHSPEDYDFLWDYPFEGPVTFFQIHELGDDPLFEIIRRTDTYFQGKFVCDTDFAERFYRDIRSCYVSMLRCGLIDDDQTPPIICVRERPDVYHSLPSSWFSNMDDYCTGREPKRSPRLEPEFLKVGVVLRLAWAKRCLKTLWREFRFQAKRYPL